MHLLMYQIQYRIFKALKSVFIIQVYPAVWRWLTEELLLDMHPGPQFILGKPDSFGL